MIKLFGAPILCLAIVVVAHEYSCNKRPKEKFTQTENIDPSKYDYCVTTASGARVCATKQ